MPTYRMKARSKRSFDVVREYDDKPVVTNCSKGLAKDLVEKGNRGQNIENPVYLNPHTVGQFGAHDS